MVNEFKTFSGSVPPLNTQRIAKAHGKDPRLVRPVAGSLDQAADVHQLVDTKARLRRGFISQHDARLELETQARTGSGLKNVPAQLNYTPFVTLIATANGDPKILLHRNAQRLGLILTNFTLPGNDIYYSLGPPILIESGLVGGLRLGAGETRDWSNQTVPIDDVWIFTRIANPVYVIAYEGTIALDANLL